MQLMTSSPVTLLPVFTIATLFIATSTDAFPLQLIPTGIAHYTIHRAKHSANNAQLDDAPHEFTKAGVNAAENPNLKIQDLSSIMHGQNLDHTFPDQSGQELISKLRHRRATKPSSKTSKKKGSRSMTKEVVALVNKERAKRGLKPLKLNKKLAKVADAKSRDMRDNIYFDLKSPKFGSIAKMVKKAGIRNTGVGANISAGQTSAADVMKAWMKNREYPRLRKNILNPMYKEIGVGFAKGGPLDNYWTQIFIF